jgi:hypothetical protein
MNQENFIIEMLRLLKINGIYSTSEFEKDLSKLVNSNVKKFIKIFSKDIRRRNFEDFNRFEMLNLDKKQHKRLNGSNLYRYEYRGTSNLRCIYTIINENNIDKIFLLCAFNEDGDKIKGKKSYKDNIERAIRIYINIFS